MPKAGGALGQGPRAGGPAGAPAAARAWKLSAVGASGPLRLLRFLYGGIRYMGLFNQSTANFYVSCFLLSCIRELFTVKSLNQNPREFWWSDWSKIVVVLFCLSLTDS